MILSITYGPKASPDQEIIPLSLAKMNSKIEFDDENDLLQLFVDAATAEIENYIGGPVLRRDEIVLETKWTRAISIPFEINEVSKVEWLDAAGAATEIDPLDYDVFDNEVAIGIDPPTDFHRLRITVSSGYNADDMPADIKRAALLIFAHADTYRENMPLKLNTSAQALLRPYKQY